LTARIQKDLTGS